MRTRFSWESGCFKRNRNVLRHMHMHATFGAFDIAICRRVSQTVAASPLEADAEEIILPAVPHCTGSFIALLHCAESLLSNPAAVNAHVCMPIWKQCSVCWWHPWFNAQGECAPSSPPDWHLSKQSLPPWKQLRINLFYGHKSAPHPTSAGHAYLVFYAF